MQRSVNLTPAGWEKVDYCRKRHGLSTSAWVEQAAEREMVERLPDAPYARHIPHDYRSPDALRQMMQYTIEILSTAAEARRREVQRVERQHRGDYKRISEARGEADLAFNALAWIESMDADQALRDYTYRPEGGRQVRHRFKKPHDSQDPTL